jgi:uncharacterized membrane protein YjjB (DUF3815 family)|tara:strand:- start:401 stop:688 length:288 start_codon:yes stop_codon:yes gene_type:complete
MTNQLKSALTDIFVDAATGAVVTVVLYFAFLVGGHSSPLGAAFGLGAWVFCIWTGVHCMLTDGGAIVIVSLLLGCVGIAVGIVYLIIWFFMGLFV